MSEIIKRLGEIGIIPVDWCLANDMPITPGVMTPTDINQALARGLHILKFFPAEAAGGIKALKANGVAKPINPSE